MASARPDLRALPLYKVPPPVHYEFCRVMDALLDRDWTQFASEVLSDITAVQLAEKKERRTDSLMLQWQNRNGSVGQLLDLLEKLHLMRPRDIISNWASSLPPYLVPVFPPVAASGFDPPHRPPPTEPPAAPSTCPFNQSEMGMKLPKPQPPDLGSAVHSELSVDTLPQPLRDSTSAAFSLGVCTSIVMTWTYEEVHAGTCGFCAALKVGEGGFGEVYRATLSNTVCAVKKFKKDCSLDWSLLRDSFQTEVEKLSKFRHPNIVDLLGYSDGGGTYCLIYSFMENRSLDDQLRSDGTGLSWSQRVSIAKGAATALQFLHCPPEGETPLVHGDVKSSNILLDRYWEAKLADFGLARFTPRGSSGHTSTQTCSFGKTQEVRGTLAYLPADYVRGSCKLNTAVDVYGFGVVLLEILTGRRALEKDKKTGRDVSLKDLVNGIDDSEAEWRKQLDKRLQLSYGVAEPTGFMQVVSLARSCCMDKWKKRPSMTEVYKTLEKLHDSLSLPSSAHTSLPSKLCSSPASAHSHPRAPRSLDSGMSALSLKSAGPSGHTRVPKPSSLSPPQTLHSSIPTPTNPPSGSSSSSPPCSSFDGPCETDESRGYSQYDIRSNSFAQKQCVFNVNQHTQRSVPTEEQYNFPPNAEDKGLTMNPASEFPQCSSPAESLQSQSPGYNQGLIQTSEQHFRISSKNINLLRSPAESRQPEESDELDYLQSKTQ